LLESALSSRAEAEKEVEFRACRNYRNHVMKTSELTVTRVGNSRGVRLPAEVLRRYHIGDTLIMEQRVDEIALRPRRARNQKLSWAETYQRMAQTDEDWTDLESLPEGLHHLPGEQRK
jgi:antitoxin component of MazEF toxin-antitoxin module